MSEPWPECPLEKSRADKKPHTEEMASPATDVPLLISTSPILDKSGEYLGVVYVAKDISRQKKTLTDLVETKKKLEEAMRIRSEFTSMVSHELRTPLTAIREGISLVLSKKTGPITDEQSELLSLAKTNVDRLTRLINDILDFQCLDSGKMTFSMEEYDISVVLEEVWRSMAPAAQEKGLAFHLHVQPDLPILRFDRDRIVQVVTNLINNAVKFTSRGSVTIRVFRGDNNIEVSIEDTGPGIAESDIPKLFHKFSQLESGTERKIGSSGLGLAICRQIIEAHRGKVKVKSELGRGSTFCFLLPIHERRG
jgi:signal transduction histidine kinase